MLPALWGYVFVAKIGRMVSAMNFILARLLQISVIDKHVFDIYIYIYVCIYMYIHTLHYITLHYITFTLHYITLHTYITYINTYIHTYITLHYITLHYISLHYITLHYITYIHTYITYIHTYIYMNIYICTYQYDNQFLCGFPIFRHPWRQTHTYSLGRLKFFKPWSIDFVSDHRNMGCQFAQLHL